MIEQMSTGLRFGIAVCAVVGGITIALWRGGRFGAARPIAGSAIMWSGLSFMAGGYVVWLF